MRQPSSEASNLLIKLILCLLKYLNYLSHITQYILRIAHNLSCFVYIQTNVVLLSPCMNPHSFLHALLPLLISASHVTGAITTAKAVSLAPTLLDQLAGLEESLEAIQTSQMVMAAIKMRSLVPDYTVDIPKKTGTVSSSEDDSEDEKTRGKSDDEDGNTSQEDSDSDSDSDFEPILTSRAILVNSLNSLIKSLPRAYRDAALNQIAAFDFSGSQAFEEFLEHKEKESAIKLNESITAIHSIQNILQSNSVAKSLSVDLLARIVSQLDSLQDEYEELQELEIQQTKSLKTSKKGKTLKQLAVDPKNSSTQKQLGESRAKIAKIVDRLANTLDLAQ